MKKTEIVTLIGSTLTFVDGIENFKTFLISKKTTFTDSNTSSRIKKSNFRINIYYFYMSRTR